MDIEQSWTFCQQLFLKDTFGKAKLLKMVEMTMTAISDNDDSNSGDQMTFLCDLT